MYHCVQEIESNITHHVFLSVFHRLAVSKMTPNHGEQLCLNINLFKIIEDQCMFCLLNNIIILPFSLLKTLLSKKKEVEMKKWWYYLSLINCDSTALCRLLLYIDLLLYLLLLLLIWLDFCSICFPCLPGGFLAIGPEVLIYCLENLLTSLNNLLFLNHRTGTTKMKAEP